VIQSREDVAAGLDRRPRRIPQLLVPGVGQREVQQPERLRLQGRRPFGAVARAMLGSEVGKIRVSRYWRLALTIVPYSWP